jgi:hypothetical protein
MAAQSSFGVCESCGARKGKAAIATHLKQCLPTAAGKRCGPVMLLRVQPAGAPVFWLHVAAGMNARLGEVDDLLRHVWLECCGHMSEFFRNKWDEVDMNCRITEVFRAAGDELRYVYDFGSSTELFVRFGGITEAGAGKPFVAARNEPPVWPCDVCGLPAASLCTECGWRGVGFCCVKHAPDHECGEDMLLPVVNSPRMGVCGYSGQTAATS